VASRLGPVRLYGRVSGLIRDTEFRLEQEQRPDAGRDAAAALGIAAVSDDGVAEDEQAPAIAENLDVRV